MPGSVELFKKYPNKCFIETGTYYGTGTRQAIDAGFEEIHTIEVHRPAYEIALQNLKDYTFVHCYLGSSLEKLKEILPSLNKRCTFWLDSHYTGPTSGFDEKIGQAQCPICMELDIIKEHNIKDHTILIDDINNPGLEDFEDDRIRNIKSKCLEINSNYKFKYDNGAGNLDVLVVYL